MALTKTVNGQRVKMAPEEEAAWLATQPGKAEREADQWCNIRADRDELLSACDWTQAGDSPFKDDPGWLAYRKALRDIPSVFDNPAKVVWPVPPK